jgi:hypothetical protein
MAVDNEPLWILTDNLRPVPFREGGEEMPIYSVQQLVETLRNFATQKPRVLILTRQDGVQLFIGMSGKLAGVRVYPDAPTGRSWSATPETTYSSEDLWVTSEGEPSLFDADCVMPIEEVIDIVTSTVEHDKLPDTVKWINARGEVLR